MKTLFASFLLVTSLFAGLQVGTKFPDTTLPDQHDIKHYVSNDDRIILMSFEKDTSVAINDYLKTKPANFITKRSAKFVSDIHSMPSFITNMFALPKMRDYKYPVMLIYDDAGKKYDYKEEKITVYRLDGRIITSISFIDPKELPALLGE